MNVVPKLQKPAPYFKGTALINSEFKEIKSSDYIGEYLVLFFYPMDFTFVCPTEIIAFSNAADELKKIKTNVVACSTDSQYSHFAWTSMSPEEGGVGELKIPLLSDRSTRISRAYGVLDEDTGIAFRGAFIIDDKGMMRQITINDLPIGRSVQEIKRLVQAVQFSDQHGALCPIEWQPGDKGVVVDLTPKGDS